MKHKNITISHLASKLPDVLSALSINNDLCQRLEIQGTCTYSVVIINAVNIVPIRLVYEATLFSLCVKWN